MAAQENIIITGSNIGLGFETAKLLSDKPYHIILTSRTLQKAQNAAKELKSVASKATFAAYELDISSPESLTKFGEQIREAYGQIDVLVHNAAINNFLLETTSPEDVSLEATKQRFELAQELYATNVVGADALTYQILPLLRKAAKPRLVFITSGLGSMTLNLDPSDAWYGVPSYNYRASKAALNMMMTTWHKRLSKEGVAVWTVCPGFNATTFGGFDPVALRKSGATEPEVGAGIIADVVLGKRMGEEGKTVTFVNGQETIQPW